MEPEKALAKAQAAKVDLRFKDFFWLVQNCKGEDLIANEYVDLMEMEGKPFLACKRKEVFGVRPVQNEEGKFGIIIYVGDAKAPAITGTVLYP